MDQKSNCSEIEKKSEHLQGLVKTHGNCENQALEILHELQTRAFSEKWDPQGQDIPRHQGDPSPPECDSGCNLFVPTFLPSAENVLVSAGEGRVPSGS